ncbi:MAG: hypothetical protein KF760_21915 [Candidatus Eremiobacteraeota bacterium]|nr:hypothetical protein [Candidatus Eremiobacteraeota bacterium]
MDLMVKPQWTEKQELAWATVRGSLLGLWESHYGDASFRQNEDALKYGFTACRHFDQPWDDVLEMSLAASFAGDWKKSLMFVRRGWEMAQDPCILDRLQRFEA